MLTVQNLQRAENEWLSQLEKEPEVLAFDLAKLNFIDSSAIGSLVKLLNNASHQGTKLLFVDISAAIQDMFSAVKLDKFFTILSKKDFNSTFNIHT